MKKFIVIYHAPAELAAQVTNTTPEQQAKGMEAWMTWAKNMGSHLVEMGSPLMGGQQISGDGKTHASMKEVGGYSILQAENMEAAKALMNGHPHLQWSPKAYVEIHEFMPIPGM